VSVLEQMFLLQRVEAWSPNHLSRLVKTPKMHFFDSGVLSTLLKLTPENAAKKRSVFGRVLETFIFGELAKQAACSQEDYRIYHYRDRDQNEVDFIIENEAGEIIGVEVKAGATINRGDLRGLRRLADYAGENMRMGVILYDGDKSLPFGNNIHCAPISSLWAE
jgi:hypothetical protein